MSWNRIQRMGPNGLQWGLRWLDTLARARNRNQDRPQHLVTGSEGEEAALFDLQRRGFAVVAQRWNDGPTAGDLDLIAWDADVLCFIEVKTRTTRAVATASSAVDRNKRRILRRLARHYLRHLPGSEDPERQTETRFDIVTVYRVAGEPEQIQLIPGAFGWRESGRDD